MEEFIKVKGKILKIENPISMFSTILSLSNSSESQVKPKIFKNYGLIRVFI